MMSAEYFNHYGLPVDIESHRKAVLPRTIEVSAASLAMIEAISFNADNHDDTLDRLAEVQYANLPLRP